MIIYSLETTELTVEQLDTMCAALPIERQRRAQRIVNPITRRESIAAAYLAFYALLQENINGGLCCIDVKQLLLNVDKVRLLAAAIGWQIGEHGKPFSDGCQIGDSVLYVSLSHSDGLVVVAVACEPLGVDVQRITEKCSDDLLRISTKFHPKERERLKVLPSVELSTSFYRMWVCKESVMKLCGRGLSLPLSSFCIGEDGFSQLNGHRICLDVKLINNAVLATAVWE